MHAMMCRLRVLLLLCGVREEKGRGIEGEEVDIRMSYKECVLEVRLCGDEHNTLASAVHTNITLVYALDSHSRLTGCHNLISSDVWHDDGKWQTAVPFKSRRARERK